MNWRQLVALWCMVFVTVLPATGQDLLTYYSFDAPPDAGPDAEFRTGETITDDSGNGRYLRVSGEGITWTSEGRLNGAIRMSGGPGFLKDPNANRYLNGLDAFTITVWIRSEVIGTDAGIVNTQPPDDDDQNISLRYDADGLFGGGVNVVKGGVRTRNGKQEYESRWYAQATTWQHLALIYESGEPLRLIINGTVDNPTYAPLKTSGVTVRNVHLRVGEGAKGRSDIWDGLMDELRIYDGVLTPPEVRSVMEEELPVELASFNGTADGTGAVLHFPYTTLFRSTASRSSIGPRARTTSRAWATGWDRGRRPPPRATPTGSETWFRGRTPFAYGRSTWMAPNRCTSRSRLMSR